MTYFTFRSAGHPWATVILIGWIFIENLLLCLDSIIWRGDSPEEWWEGQIYCDINSRIKSAFVIGVPGAAVGLCRFLADVTNPKIEPDQLQSTRWRRNVFDLTFGVILPLVNAGLKLLVMPARYAISGVHGCVGLTYPTWLSIPLYWGWTPILSLVAAVYACISYCVSRVNVAIFLRHWWVLSRQYKYEWGLGLTTGISQTDFRRLLLTAIYVIVVYFPLSIFLFVMQLKETPLRQYSWERIHGPQWAIIQKIESPRVVWNVWLAPSTAITLFSVLGTTKNAMEGYNKLFKWVRDCGGTVYHMWKPKTPPKHGNREEDNSGEAIEVIVLNVQGDHSV